MVQDSLVHEAWSRLFLDSSSFDYTILEEYNRRLGDYNANIQLHGKKLTLKYNLKWKNVDQEIRIGLIQSLLLKMFARKKGVSIKTKTFNLDLYQDFSKRIPEIASAVVDISDNCLILKESFDRINAQFFAGLVDEPKLEWGKDSVRKLASYNYHTDTISVSTVFKLSENGGMEVASEILDLLMYHELLHKVHGFHCKGGRTHTHTPAFKRAERLFPSKDLVEKKIERHVTAYEFSKRRKRVSASRNVKRKPRVPRKAKNMFDRLVNFLE